MSKQKMHCGLRRSSSNGSKVSDRGKGFLPRKSLEQNLKVSTVEREAASVIWGSRDLRHCTVKFLIVEPDGHWGVLALPLLCPDNSNYLGSGAQPKMDDLVVVSPPVDSFKTGQHKGGTDSLLDVICSTKSLADGRFSQSDVHHQSGNDIDAANSSEGSIDSSKAQKNAKKNARRKARKKAKRKNKHLSDTGSTEPEILSEESALGSSTSETSFNHDMDHGEGLVSHESIPVNSSPDCLISVNDSEGESNGITNCSESSETCTSDTDGIDVSEDTVTSVIHNFTGKYPAFNSEDGIQTKDMGFSISKGLEGKHGETIHSCDDISSNVFPDMPDSLVLGSVSVGCSSEDSTNARYDSNTAMMVSSNSDAPARINIQEKELSVFPVLWNGQKGSGSVAQSYSQNDCPEPELQTSGVEDVASELVHSLQDCTGNLEPPERCSAMSNTKDLITEDQNISILESLGYLNVPNLHEEQSAVHLHPLIGKEVAEVDNEVSLSEYSKEEHGSASVIRKWKPAEKKDNGFSSLGRLHISLQVHADEPAADGWSPKNSVEGKLSSNSQKHISSHKSEMCVDHRSGNVNGSSPEDKSPVQNICTPKQLNNKHPAVNCSTHTCKEKHIYAFGADSSKISGALHEAYRVQQLSESVQLATGSPIADFERLLHAASPIICQSNSVKICQSCLRDEVGGHLCPHKASNITLRSLWKWYEKNGSYGLEVRLEDYEYSKGLCFHHSAFQAYFVPYLSAVQLFKKPKNHCMNNVPVVSGACEVSKTLQSSSNIRHLPIFKVLIPRPHTKETSFSPLENQMCSSRASSMSQSADTTTDDLELLFEYFESDQPQLRKPLFEKIKELVRGDGPSWYKAYGDPTKLESMNLDELHHSSWYSVAWYPIYRIPDGELRAAFLTYHSFGHLVHRGSTFDSHRKDACIVSPVVGLLSYNAQREGWFHLKHPILNKTEAKASEILRERLKTLEQTASLLARAEVKKGNLKAMNRHPDYEFFLSRQRW